jgi:hypothetical protein
MTGARSSPTATGTVRLALHDNAPYVGLVAIYVFSGVVVLRGIGWDVPYAFTDIYRTPVVLTIVYLLLTGLVAIASDVFVPRRRPFDRETWRLLYHRWFGSRRLVGTLIVLATLPGLLDVMLGYRMALTDFRPFTYDELFMQLDRILHLGRHPWEWLHPLLGYPAVTFVVDRAYVYGWFSLLWIGVIWQAVHGREPVRLQFLLAFAASWVLLGTLAAITFSSAGPVYYGRVTGLFDPYEPLMSYLYTVDVRTPLHALENQERLWLTYRTWGGITAMPSMHLAIATVVSLAAVTTWRPLVFVVLPIWLLMLLGSVHLGWHYAVDSYAGVLAAAILWVVSGRVSRWWITRRPQDPVASAESSSSRRVA